MSENINSNMKSQERLSEEISPNILKLKGIIKLPDDFNLKKSLVNELFKKYKIK